MPLLKLFRVAGEFVLHLPPDAIRAGALQQLPVLLDLRARLRRHQLQRPQQDLPEVPDERIGLPIGHFASAVRAFSC